ncbi:hypothetical protein GCM10010174_03700 [Kutzneria viridogrisea]|uniref:Uncharacterized protein n=1 Tax=Kutzneria viridogrisea TaxID=47990 RepID=A0ABR6BS12_9PSEU|nr:hypothetical protein [Kutzneria viridogrisea]
MAAHELDCDHPANHHARHTHRERYRLRHWGLAHLVRSRTYCLSCRTELTKTVHIEHPGIPGTSGNSCHNNNSGGNMTVFVSAPVLDPPVTDQPAGGQPPQQPPQDPAVPVVGTIQFSAPGAVNSVLADLIPADPKPHDPGPGNGQPAQPAVPDKKAA